MDEKKLNHPADRDVKADQEKHKTDATESGSSAKHHKSFKEKVKDALQEWSNDNERDIQEDDSTPLRSGL